MKLELSVWKFVVLGSLLGCGSGAPEPKAAPRQSGPPDAPEARHSEWLYATKGFGGNLAAECAHVQRAIEAEQKCRGEACLYGARLADDWMKRCEDAKSELLPAVRQRAGEYQKRARGERVPCMREIEPVLRDGCNSDPECAQKLQSWVTRCSAEVGSPLVVRILESRVESAGRRRVELDRRDCATLGRDVSAAQNCAPRFQCEDALQMVDMYRDRCRTPPNLPSFKVAVAELSVRLGAGQTPVPIAIAPEGPELSDTDVAVPLRDGSGAIVMVCGERPKDMSSYIELRRGCKDGEVIVIERHADRTQGIVRIGRLPHADDLTFSRLYPRVLAQGETEARVDAGLERLVLALSATLQALPEAGATYHREAGAKLIEALESESFAVRRANGMPPVLKHRDAELTELFRALAQAKLKVALALKPAEQAVFARRALKHPLSDVGVDGAINIGQTNPMASVNLAELFPQAISAYASEIHFLTYRVRERPLNQWQVDQLLKKFTEALRRCNTAQQRAVEKENALLECSFGEPCAAERHGKLTQELETARAESVEAYRAFMLAGDSLDAAPATPASEQRCLEPWW